MSSTFSDVAAFVAEERGAPLQRIAPETTLFGDLGMDGDDAVEFFTEFFRRFEVESGNFQISRHFGSEGWPLVTPFALLWRAIRFIAGDAEETHERAGLMPVRIADLVAAVEARRWTLY
jgi:hypothetical protein